MGEAKRMALTLPRPAGDLDEAFWRHCAGGKLCFQRCSDCGVWRHLPRHMCGECGSLEWEWAESCGRGRVYSWTTTHRAMHPAFKDCVPYVSAVIELEEGVRMVAALAGVSAADMELDLPVLLGFESVCEDVRLPVFTVAGRAD